MYDNPYTHVMPYALPVEPRVLNPGTFDEETTNPRPALRRRALYKAFQSWTAKLPAADITLASSQSNPRVHRNGHVVTFTSKPADCGLGFRVNGPPVWGAYYLIGRPIGAAVQQVKG